MPDDILRFFATATDNRLNLFAMNRTPHSTLTRLGAILLISNLLLIGCTSTPKQRSVDTKALETPALIDSEILNRAQQSEALGHLVIAAQDYRTLAEQTQSPMQEYFLLKTAEVLARGGYLDEAQGIIDRLDQYALTNAHQLQRQLIRARLALKREDPNQALNILRFPITTEMDSDQIQQIHHMTAEAYAAVGNYLESSQQRVLLDPLLIEPERRQQNHQRLWRALNQLSSDTIENQITNSEPSEFIGWLELAYYVKNAPKDPALLQEQLTFWKKRYPTHAAAGKFFNDILANKEKLTGHPQQIALLLPLSGNFSAPATAIRDGFFAAYYAREDQAYRPNIRIYNTESNIEIGQLRYQQALADGADFIVGPLNKQLVEALTQKEEINTPTLALNYALKSNVHDKLYQFGLLPEDEARQVAERAWLDGHNRALVLAPEGEWGDRMRNTFNQHWNMLNGNIIETQRYDPSQNDASDAVKNLLNIDESKQRFRKLKQLLGKDIKFEPRRRQDADFIYLAAFPRQARQIRPQIKFHYAADLPIYSTSHAYGGVTNTTLDRDLDGILFCDMPWVLSPEKTRRPNWHDIEREWTSTSHAFRRLYAMGVDAYQLIPWLGYLKSHQDEHLKGNTGNLYIDKTNRVHRQLIWSRFQRGTAQLLDSNVNAL